MNCFLRNRNNPAVIEAKVRLNAKEYAAVRSYMHTAKDQTQITFPRGITLAKVGCGWYVLRPRNEYEAEAGMLTAIRIITKAIKEREETERMARNMVTQNVQAYVDANHGGHFISAKSIHESKGGFRRGELISFAATNSKPGKSMVDQNKLAALAAKFGRQTKR
jgi:hypothetical protein